ncbi:MAG: PEP-CTERM sorting domain-containing protein [Armatimonadota bacterium]
MKTRMTALAVVIISVASAGMASAWTAYNDCGGLSGNPNVTSYQIPNGSVTIASGLLKDYATGSSLGVTATPSASSTATYWYGVPSFTHPAGSDAAIFTGKVDFNGSPEMNNATDWYQYDISGLNPGRTYKFKTTFNRSGTGYENRKTNFTLSGATSWLNQSSAGTTISGDGSSTIINVGNNALGLVACWSNINPGSDGIFTVKGVRADAGIKSYGFGYFELQEVVPEPSSMLAMGGGLLSLAGFAIRRRTR